LQPEKYAILATDDSVAAEFYPLGRRLWRVGAGICQKVESDHLLTLTTCRGGQEFTCDDGTCINMTEVQHVRTLSCLTEQAYQSGATFNYVT
jgi:hypothetical protein